MSAIDEKRFVALNREWIARFDFNAMCAVEERRGCAFLEVVAPMMQRLDVENADEGQLVGAARMIKMSDIRLLFHQALLGAHPDLTEAEAGELIGQIGFSEAMAIVAWAVVRGLNAAGGSAAGGENPSKAKKGRS